jgi:hypothetical protein
MDRRDVGPWHIAFCTGVAMTAWPRERTRKPMSFLALSRVLVRPLSPEQNQLRETLSKRNVLILLSDVGLLQCDLVGVPRAIPVERGP